MQAWILTVSPNMNIICLHFSYLASEEGLLWLHRAGDRWAQGNDGWVTAAIPQRATER